MNIFITICKWIMKLCCLYVKLVVGIVVFLGSILILLTIFIFSANSNKNEIADLDNKVVVITPSNEIIDHQFLSNFEEELYKMNDDRSPYSYADQIIKALDYAAKDPKVTGVILDLSYNSTVSYGISDRIGKEIEKFKQSSKPLITYAPSYSQSNYYLASFTDDLSLDPTGAVDLHGININNLYFKDLLDKYDLAPIVFKHGKYKSAVEPFLLNEMSEEARENYTAIVTNVWNEISTTIAKNRNLTASKLLLNIEEKYLHLLKHSFNDANAALDRKLVDHIESYQQFMERAKGLFKDTYTKDEFGNNQLTTMDYKDYLDIKKSKARRAGGNKIIKVVYMSGEITGISNDDRYISYNQFAKKITEIGDNPKIKAVVLRINSPGGSVTEALRLVNLIQEKIIKKGKKVIISQGSLAASGGYMLSTLGEYIYAEPTTLTGSIGVFGLLPNFKKVSNNIGINYSEVTNNPGEYTNPFQDLSSYARSNIEGSIENTYATFLKMVATSRNMKIDEVDQIAQGRVWTGVEAKKIGLVDEIGTLDDAISYAAESLKLKRYHVDYDNNEAKFNLGKLFFKKIAIRLNLQNYIFPKELLNLKQINPKQIFTLPYDEREKIYVYSPLMLE